MKTLLMAALLAAGAPFAAPARAAAPDRQETRQSWDDYRIKARKDLDVLEDKIAKLERLAKTANADVRARQKAEAKELRAKKGDAERMLNQLATATEEARLELQAKLDRLLRDLKRSVHKAEVRPRDRT